MKKILAITLTVLILPATLIAGFNFGLIKAAKKRVDKIDAKVIESRSAATTPTPDTQAPTVPTSLTAVPISSSQINLSWTASTDNTGVASYKIYRDAGAIPIATPTGTTYSDTAITALTPYSYTVSACDAASNCSAQSLAASTTTLDGQAPTVPTGLMAVAISSVQINLSWTASTDNVGVTSYNIYRDGGATPIATPTGTTYSDTGLINTTLYSYTVSACDAVSNCSGQSSSTSDTTAPPYPAAGGEWVFVPGSATIGTSDFYVMKYEAKNVGSVATAQTETTPWVNITHPSAVSACTALGAGFHLLTIAETQTINRNIEAQGANWANGIVGSLISADGGLKRGNAGTTDSASYTLATLGPDYVGAGSGSDRTSTSKAKLVLSNGNEIWDWAGNVFEWIYGAGAGGTLGAPSGVTFDTSLVQDWNVAGLNDERPILGPSNNSYTNLYGVGKYVGSASTNAVLRGGAWGYGASPDTNGGAYYLNFNSTTGEFLTNIGFRCAK